MNKPHAPTRTDSAIGSVRPVEGYAGDVSPEMAYLRKANRKDLTVVV
jgi:hypothetical protein